PKTICCKYLYDQAGSRLFKQIMELEEYYPTRCELEILENHKEQIAALVGGARFALVELGAGDGLKTKVLLSSFLERGLQFRYVPIDISESALKGLTAEIKTVFCGLQVQGLATDYFAGLKWLSRTDRNRSVVLFLGSNIGNFSPCEAEIFLKHVRCSMNAGDFALIGFDLKKDTETMVRAYNDSRGVTARFNMNVLRRINDELGGNFDLNCFEYYSSYNPRSGAVESFLISRHKQEVWIEACRQTFYFDEWEPIHTESSYKFREREFAGLAEKSGFEVRANFYDTRRFFANSLWQARR
ncbi:MAG TPA: L-histidine N(alpha)-methyltransferase, partial [Desulfomonilaceae bacterium]|nr:L-histidine N(alpha)-methyltransferase [Desulfomonilaceae bacterium]